MSSSVLTTRSRDSDSNRLENSVAREADESASTLGQASVSLAYAAEAADGASDDPCVRLSDEYPSLRSGTPAVQGCLLRAPAVASQLLRPPGITLNWVGRADFSGQLEHSPQLEQPLSLQPLLVQSASQAHRGSSTIRPSDFMAATV